VQAVEDLVALEAPNLQAAALFEDEEVVSVGVEVGQSHCLALVKVDRRLGEVLGIVALAADELLLVGLEERGVVEDEDAAAGTDR